MSQSAPEKEDGQSKEIPENDSINNYLQDAILHSVGMVLRTT